jgi:hypothetical protein
VTAAALPDDLAVIDSVDSAEGIGVVAVFANIGGLYMRRRFAGSRCSVVTADAIAADCCVIKDRAAPCVCIMAVVALRGRCNMIGWFACCCCAVVAAAALPNHLAVINTVYRSECIGIVAVFTDISCLNMCW